MKKTHQPGSLSRRSFFKLAAASSLGAAVMPEVLSQSLSTISNKPATNIQDALKYPRNKWSMPGLFPGQVIQVTHDNCVAEGRPQQEAANQMLSTAMMALTGVSSLRQAWRNFVSPGEKIGLKINPIGGKLLSTSHELVSSVISQLLDAGIQEKDITIWDRREFQLHEAGFTPQAYPGIQISGTERKNAEGSFYGPDGQLLSEEMIDKQWYYWADVEGEYDAYTLPYMVNGGKHSYFSRFLTQQVDKVINLPILKNAGSSITLCLKNLGYGVISNTGRLHKDLWAETSAEVCCFPPVRDKVVLNIVDGMIGCFNGGPGANPQFICNYNTLLVGTDPVAVDRIGYDIILEKRISEGIQASDVLRSRYFMEYAQQLGLGTADPKSIALKKIALT